MRATVHLLGVREVVVDLLVENVKYHIEKIPAHKIRENE
jgi:hypothetical protein